jgi:translation initiation factor IF-2
MLPNNVSVAENEVLRAFERWSQQSRLSVTSIKPQWKRTADDYMTLECRADAFGSLEALTRFLYDVERDSLALKVEAVEITTRDNEGQQLSLALQVSGLLLSPQEP